MEARQYKVDGGVPSGAERLIGAGMPDLVPR
jgi:hypothetical protein